MSVETPTLLSNLFSDISCQPEWRGRAAKEMAWRDSIQWTKTQLETFERLNLPEDMFVNLMASAIEAVTGHEAKHRVDWMVTASDESQDDMAEAVNHQLNDAMRLADANQACSDAYEPQVGVGIGWVRVGRNPNILSPSKYLIEDIHRDEMFWDMRARSVDLKTDCRWIARRKFFDKDEAKRLIPSEKDLIDFTFSDFGSVDLDQSAVIPGWLSTMSEYSDPIELIMDTGNARHRVAIYETYYKVFEPRDLLIFPDGHVVEFKNSPMHTEMLMSGGARIEQKVAIPIVKEAWFVGPHCIYDGATRQPHNDFPYVPFFGSREDASNVPTGLLRRAIGPQAQYNQAVMEIQSILRRYTIIKDEDATPGMDDRDVVHETMRAEGVINLKKGRKFDVRREWDKLNALEGICTRARTEINAATGIYQTFQGQQEGKQSGVAVENIAELGAQTLGKINSNYQLARKNVGDLVFSYLIEDIGTGRKVVRVPQSSGQSKKEVILNDGVDNRVSMFRAGIALRDVHTSAGYRQHSHQRLNSIMEMMPEETRMALLPMWLESSEMPDKEEAIKIINKQNGFIDDEEQRALAEQQAMQDAADAKQIEKDKLNADIEEKHASAADKNAQAAEHTASASKKRVETLQLLKNIRSGVQTEAGGRTDPLQPSPSGGSERMTDGQQPPVAPTMVNG